MTALGIFLLGVAGGLLVPLLVASARRKVRDARRRSGALNRGRG